VSRFIIAFTYILIHYGLNTICRLIDNSLAVNVYDPDSYDDLPSYTWSRQQPFDAESFRRAIDNHNSELDLKMKDASEFVGVMERFYDESEKFSIIHSQVSCTNVKYVDQMILSVLSLFKGSSMDQTLQACLGGSSLCFWKSPNRSKYTLQIL
jgi:hypothetical protein